MRKWKILPLVLLLFLSSCRSEEPAQNVRQPYVLVDDYEMHLGMTLDEAMELQMNDRLELNQSSGSDMYENIEYALELEEGTYDNQILGQRAWVRGYYDLDRTLVQLDVIWDDGYDQNALLEELIRSYGEDYKRVWIKYYVVIEEVYKWDLEDGVSILWWPECEHGDNPFLLMVYTDELTSEVPAPEQTSEN